MSAEAEEEATKGKTNNQKLVGCRKNDQFGQPMSKLTDPWLNGQHDERHRSHIIDIKYSFVSNAAKENDRLIASNGNADLIRLRLMPLLAIDFHSSMKETPNEHLASRLQSSNEK